VTILEVSAVPFNEFHRGGGESYPWRLSQALSEIEEVLPCFAVGPGEPVVREPTMKVPGWFLEVPPFLTRHNPLPTPQGLGAIRRVLRQRDDVEFVHIHNLRTAMSTAWILLSHLNRSGRRYKVILTDHGARWFPFPGLTAPIADYFVAVSEASREQMLRYADRPSFVLPPGVPADYPGVVARPRPFGERTIDLIFFGRIAPWKRPDLAIALAERIRKETGSTPSLVVAGTVIDASFLKWLRIDAEHRGVGEQVRFVLAPSEAEAAELLGRSKVHLFLSRSEDVFGRRYPAAELASATILEAAACGTPSVCTDLPGVREQVIHGRTGFVVPAPSWEDLVAHTQRLLADPSGWEAMSRACRAFVEEERSYTVLAARFSALLGQIRRGEL
jgi:glycosyltransferase involved in cell wall biosynthesis